MPKLTESVFLSHPSYPQKRMYLTGDFARWEEDGNLLFLGRIDTQVKIGGHRIEPEEIASVMRGIENISDACVTPVGESDGKRLAAYYTGSAETDDIRAYLHTVLPRYMVPHFFTHLDSLPLTASGKINHKALPDPTMREAAEAREAESEEEIALLSVVRDVLENRTLGIDAHFFAAGGDSIRAIQAASRLRERGWSLSAADFFENPVICDLALCMRRSDIPAPREAADGPVRATPILAWFRETVTAHPGHFNQSVMLKSGNEIDAASLEQALRAIWRHHDALRMVTADEGFTILPADTPFSMEYVDLRDVLEQDGAMSDTAESVQTGFDLAAGSLFRAVLFRRKNGDCLLLAAHHLVVDGISWHILAHDIETAYTSARNGESAGLPAKTTGFRSWAETIHGIAESGGFDGELPYWRSVLDAACDTLGDLGNKETMASRTTSISGENAAGILEDGISQEPLARMLAALACALDQWRGLNRVRVLLEGHGRNLGDREIDVSRTVGWFTAAWPFVLECAHDINKAFTRVHTALKDIPGGGVGYGALRYTAGHDELAVTPDISFNYLGRTGIGDGVFTIAGDPTGETVSPENCLGHALEFMISAERDALEIHMSFNTGRIPEHEADYLLELFTEWLKKAASCRSAAFDYTDFGDGGIDGFLENI